MKSTNFFRRRIRTSEYGERDYALLLFLYNSGARSPLKRLESRLRI